MTVGTLNQAAFSLNEAAYGTAPATATKCYPFKANKPTLERKSEGDQGYLMGIYEDQTETVLTQEVMKWSPEIAARYDALGFFFTYALGTDTVTDAAPNYTHTITVKEGDLDSFSVFWKDALEQVVYPGCKINKLTLEGQAGGMWTIKADIIGQGVKTVDVSALPAYTAESLIPFAALSSVKINDVEYKDALLSFSLTFESAMNPDDELGAGSTHLTSLERTSLSVTANATFKKNENVIEGLVINSTTPAVVLTLSKDVNTSCTITMPKVQLTGGSAEGQREKLKQTVEMKALYDSVTKKAIDVVVKNQTATYASA